MGAWWFPGLHLTSNVVFSSSETITDFLQFMTFQRFLWFLSFHHSDSDKWKKNTLAWLINANLPDFWITYWWNMPEPLLRAKNIFKKNVSFWFWFKLWIILFSSFPFLENLYTHISQPTVSSRVLAILSEKKGNDLF